MTIKIENTIDFQAIYNMMLEISDQHPSPHFTPNQFFLLILLWGASAMIPTMVKLSLVPRATSPSSVPTR